MTPNIRKVKIVSQNLVYIQFKNGVERLFDLTPYLSKGIFRELRNPEYLKKVRAIEGGIQWPHEQDFSADTLYYAGTSLREPQAQYSSRAKSRPKTKKQSKKQ